MDAPPDLPYLAEIERLANAVCDEALEEGWLTYRVVEEGPDTTPLQRAINELARTLRHVHTADDGCLDD